jgi:uncharacterized protein (DUF2249 family)
VRKKPRIYCETTHKWRDLKTGDYFVLINDHDPVPLRYQFEAEFKDSFAWDALVKRA